jgi:hypothetical protein
MYYTGEDEGTIKGALSIRDARCTAEPKKPNVYNLQITGDQKRSYFLYSDNETTRDTWLAAITHNASLDRRLWRRLLRLTAALRDQQTHQGELEGELATVQAQRELDALHEEEQEEKRQKRSARAVQAVKTQLEETRVLHAEQHAELTSQLKTLRAQLAASQKETKKAHAATAEQIKQSAACHECATAIAQLDNQYELSMQSMRTESATLKQVVFKQNQRLQKLKAEKKLLVAEIKRLISLSSNGGAPAAPAEKKQKKKKKDKAAE